ncbi:hypothetical protein GS399_05410 [Pedobacter sp. HMF7647]|uniref:Type II secretion system protein GspC N-terminal domain-containing protein n=1 Tax=Hufsiella arboris TaxID=2695275 RepID=A0A7K1Y756_9SPHI|nr:hypothetical protein [Hufsiella arboris]MXV50403.1 hypothetical protein [Hufsiella arboris]
MKKKQLTYLLLLAVLGIWGIIIYRLIFSGQDELLPVPGVGPGVQAAFLSDKDFVSDTARLWLNYPDPFTGETGAIADKSVSTVVPEKQVMLQAPVVRKPVVSWPMMSYNGFVVRQASHQLIALLTISGQEKLLAEGERFAGVEIVRNFKDSLKVRYAGETKYVKLR